MTLDIKGGLKNTKISSNPYVAVEEMLSNAIDSYLIRRNSEKTCPPFEVVLSIEFISRQLFEDSTPDLTISCTDNGAGFGDEEVKAFVTKDTTFKDHLNIPGLGKCKGAGRIQLFHYYGKLEIESTLLRRGKYVRRKLTVIEGTREISESDFIEEEIEKSELETSITISMPKRSSMGIDAHADDLRNYSAIAVRHHLFTAFLQRLIVLRGIIGEFSIKVLETRGDNLNEAEIISSELPEPIEKKKLKLCCSHNQGNKSDIILDVSTYALPADRFKQVKHEVALCANSAVVLHITNHFIKNSSERNTTADGNTYLILVESGLLEGKVNEQRDDFEIPRECAQTDDHFDDYSLRDITDSLEDYVYTILTPKDFDKEALIASTQSRFGISRGMLEEASIKVHYGDTEENIAKRVLKKFQEEIVKETADIFNLKDELSRLDPRSSDFRQKINEISWKHTSSMKRMDMANLSQLVVRRSCMLEILKRAVAVMLDCQTNRLPGEKGENEKVIHNIFFPTGKDSRDSIDHDIWILNEEYHYFDHISSDKSLASIPWDISEKLFTPDIDSSLEALFKKNNHTHSQKRPDIAIFNQEGAAIIIEFKAPGVELQDHIPDLVQYSRLLAAKSNGRISRFYCYLIGDTIDESRMPPSYKQFPSGTGYFESAPIEDPKTRLPYGEMYSEVLLYSQFISRAENRLSAYKDKLNIPL